MLNIPYEVQQALRKGDMRKNYKMKVNDVDPDTGERTYLYTIDNDSLVSESVKVDERMVTGKVLKFGLCEGSSLEFQYFDHPNINGKDVQVYCSVEYVDGNGDVAWYDIPMGWYTVDQCPMQWETGIFKVTAYNKLKSDYLDAKANKLLEEITQDAQYILYGDEDLDRLLAYALNDYKIVDGQSVEVMYRADSYYYATQKLRVYNSDGTPTNNAIYVMQKRSFFGIKNSPYYSKDDIYKAIIHYSDIIAAVVEYSEATTYYNFIVDQDGETTFGDIFVDRFFGNNPYKVSAKLNNGTQVTYSEALDIDEGLFETPYIQGLYDDSGFSPINYYYYMISIENQLSGLPCAVWVDDYDNPIIDPDQISPSANTALVQILSGNIEIVKEVRTAIGTAISTSSVSTWPEVTLRELQGAVYELNCQYGQLDRETDLFTGVELNQGGLYPADTLYPDNALYPQGNMEHPFPSTYSKLWTDTVGEQSFRYLIITYKGTENGQEVEKKLQRTVNADGTTDYNMSDNWLFRNLVWTASDVGDYADAMVLKMQNIRWFPFEMWCAGLPYVETGDAIEITDKQGNTHTSYVLTRTLDGIHNLQDTFINGELDIF